MCREIRVTGNSLKLLIYCLSAYYPTFLYKSRTRLNSHWGGLLY